MATRATAAKRKKITNMPESPHPRGRRRRRGKDWENPANNTTHMSKANVYNLRSTKPHADTQKRENKPVKQKRRKMDANTNRDHLEYYLTRMEEELDRTMEFWLLNSFDKRNGGFSVCLGRSGEIYDNTKYGWMEGRQVWMYSKLYNQTEKYNTMRVLRAAISGGEFLMKHVKRPDGRCYFQLTTKGEPEKMQRTLFTECFYAMAMAELGRATNQEKYKDEALQALSLLIYWARVDDTALGQPKLPGQTPMNSLAVPMMVLYVIDEVCGEDEVKRHVYSQDEDWAVQKILQHVQRNGKVILENVTEDGKELQGSLGRLMNPGHAIEAGWFLLQHATKRQDYDLARMAIDKFMLQPFQSGWDTKYGGIFYFLDANGLSPTQLEWNMKLWWPHTEALVAFLMAYKETKDKALLEMFDKVFQYTFSHFPDVEFGEWFGYLSQQGQVTHSFKGGPFKGCFHVPRSLFLCINMLKDILKDDPTLNESPNGSYI